VPTVKIEGSAYSSRGPQQTMYGLIHDDDDYDDDDQLKASNIAEYNKIAPDVLPYARRNVYYMPSSL
jgi:hypothetical protein